MNKASLLTATLLLTLGGQVLAQSSTDPSTNAAQRSADHIVAVVNSEPITNQEVRARLARIEVPTGAKMPSRAELARQVLEQLILEKAQLQWADTTGIKVDDAAVTEAEATVALQNRVTPEQLRERVAQSGLTREAFRANLRNELTLQRLREREGEGRVKVTEQDIDSYLQEHQLKAGGGQVVLNLAQVLIAVPENASAEQQASLQAKATQVAQRAKAGEDFAALARELSAAPEGRQGGELGARAADRYPNLFLDAVRALKVGEVTNPVRSGAGWHVLKVLEKRNPSLPDSTYTQTRVRHILISPTAQLSQQAVVDQLQQVRQRIQSGALRFDDAAREFSVDGSARAGGDLGWAVPGQFVPEFESVMNRLPLQQVSEPVVSRFGVHLIQVQERRQVELTVREQRDLVRNVLREQKAEQTFQDWVQDLRARAYVEYREPPQ